MVSLTDIRAAQARLKGVTVRTRPGQQFKVRAAVLSRLKSAFDADGIRFLGQTASPTATPPE